MSKTLLDETESKKIAGELAEQIDATGQESDEKAVKWIQEVQKKQDLAEIAQTNKEQDILTTKRKYKKNDYFYALYQMAKRRLSEFEIPKGYYVDAVLRDDKLIIGLCKSGYRWYAKGMKICGEIKYDMNCVERLVIQAMISLDELYEQHEKHRTASGIALPKQPGSTILTK